MTWHLILNLQVIETFTLIECIHVAGTSALSVSNQTRLSSTTCNIICASWRLVVIVLILAAVFALVTLVVTIRIVYKALLLEEILSSGFSLLSVILTTECIILNVDLTLVTCSAVDTLLDHANKAKQLGPLYLLRVKVVCFSYVEVTHDIIRRLCR